MNFKMIWYDASEYGRNKKLRNWGFKPPVSEKLKMNIKEQAQNYETPKTRNISELNKVLVDEEIIEREYAKADGEKFTLNVVNIEGEDYRVPTSVIKQLKSIISEKPDMTAFKVKREGSGKTGTTYTVIPLD